MRQHNPTLVNAILRDMTDAVVVIAPENRSIHYVNPAWEKLTGFTLEDALDQPAFFMESDSTPDRVVQSMWETLTEGKAWYGPLKGKRSDGSPYEVEAAIAPSQEENGQTRYFIGTLRDVTETRRHAFRNATFLADSAYDLRNPMSSLKLRLYLLKKTPERYEDHLVAMESLVERIDNIVDDLILLSRLGHDSSPAERKPLNLSEVVKRVSWAYWPLAQDKGLTLTLDLPKTPLPILADGDQIERMIVNLVANALASTPAGGKIHVTASQIANDIVLAVHDTGAGFESIPFNFERFYRTYEADCLSHSTGMAIINGIVDQHGGRIEAESGPEHVVKITLPAALSD